MISACVVCALPKSVLSQGLDDFLDEETISFAEDYDKSIRHAPRTVITISRDEIVQSGALNVGELIERIPGVHVSRSDTTANADLYVRGINGNWLILHNGIHIDRTIPDLYSLSVADVKRLEVLKGSHFSVYGPSAIVGTLNIVTFSAEKDAREGGIRAGSLDTKEVWVRKSRRFNDKGFSAFFYHSTTDGTKQIIDSDLQSGLDEELGTNASFAPSRAYFDRELTDARFTFELGEKFTIHQYFTHRESGVGTGIVQSIDPNGRESLTRLTTDIRYSKDVKKGAVDFHLTYNNEKASYDDAYFLPPGTLGGLFEDGVIQSLGQTGQEITAEVISRLVFGEHTVEMGVGGRRGFVKNEYDRRNYIVQNGSPLPVPIGEIQNFTGDESLFDREYIKSNWYVLLRDKYRMANDLTIDAGIRFDTDHDYGTVINPRIGIEWAAALDTDITFLYGESRDVPGVIQQTSNGMFAALGNPDLKAAKIRMGEIAAEHRFSDELEFTGNVFYYKRTDDIGTVDDPDSPNGRRFENLHGKEAGYGFEMMFNWNPSRQWDIDAGLGYQDASTEHDANKKAATWTPYLSITRSELRGWTCNLSITGVSDRNRESGDDRAPIKDYAITNLYLESPELAKMTHLTFSVQNVFDVDAREDVDSEITNDVPISPQRFLIGIKAGF